MGIAILKNHLERYIVGCMFGNQIWDGISDDMCGAVKHDFRTYIRRYTSTNENFEYSYPLSDGIAKG